MKDSDKIQKEFINTLASIRRSRNMTQSEVGSNQRIISRMEQHETDPRLSTVVNYLKLLGIDINDIFKEVK